MSSLQPAFPRCWCSRWLLSAAAAGVVRSHIDPGSSWSFLQLRYALQVTGLFQWCVRQSAEVENQLTSVGRICDYGDIKSEDPALCLNHCCLLLYKLSWSSTQSQQQVQTHHNLGGQCIGICCSNTFSETNKQSNKMKQETSKQSRNQRQKQKQKHKMRTMKSRY